MKNSLEQGTKQIMANNTRSNCGNEHVQGLLTILIQVEAEVAVKPWPAILLMKNSFRRYLWFLEPMEKV